MSIVCKSAGEIEKMRDEATRRGAEEEKLIAAQAELDAKTIVETAEREIIAAARAARRELKSYQAELSVTMARTAVRVDAEVDKALVKALAEQLTGEGR